MPCRVASRVESSDLSTYTVVLQVNVCVNFKSEYLERERLAAQERELNNLQMASTGIGADGDGSPNSLHGSKPPNGSEAGKKKANKKSKSKKSGSTVENELTIKAVNPPGSSKSANQKHNQKKKSTGSSSCWFRSLSGVALSSLITFLVLFMINVLIIYMIMFKNPDIADKLVEYIPHQYRDWILTKTEIFRLRVTDWISEFRTPPEEHWRFIYLKP